MRVSAVLVVLTLAALVALTFPVPSAAIDPPAALDPVVAEIGFWEDPRGAQVEAIHAVLLPTGKVLYWVNDHGVRLWDPATNAILNKNTQYPHNIFCSGHTVLPDGRVMVVGGTLAGYGFRGEDTTFFFDPETESWSQGPDMNTGRWYPTPVVAADGSVVVFSGLDETGATTDMVERFTPEDGWVAYGPAFEQSLFPRFHVMPDGLMVRTGPEPQMRYFDPSTGAHWGGPSDAYAHWAGSAAMLPDAEGILMAGGVSDHKPVVAEAAIFEWEDGADVRAVDSMANARRDLDLTVLADGSILAVGGVSGPYMDIGVPYAPEVQGFLAGATNYGPPALQPEIFDPDTETWNAVANQARTRPYHSTSLLLPDGRVWVAGGDIETVYGISQSRTFELFHPPYLFKGPRPEVSLAPEAITYGAGFEVTSPDAEDVERVAIVRLGSVTHSFDFSQRYVNLDFTATGDTLTVTAPASGGVAPPGPYMMFLVSEGGVPSVAPILFLD